MFDLVDETEIDWRDVIIKEGEVKAEEGALSFLKFKSTTRYFVLKR